MKHRVLFLSIIYIFFLSYAETQIYSIKPSHSTEIFRPDAALSNTGGIPFLIDGLHLKTGTSADFMQCSGFSVQPFLPYTKAVYVHDRWAVSAAAGRENCGSYDYTGGNCSGLQFKNTISYVQAGTAYRFSSFVSAGAACAWIHGQQSLNGSSSDFNSAADGVLYTFGIYVSDHGLFDYSLQYRTGTKLQYSGYRCDIPPAFIFGAGMYLLEELKLQAGFSYMIQDWCTRQDCISGSTYNCDNAWSLGIGIDCRFSIQFGMTADITYTNQGQNDSSWNKLDPQLNSTAAELSLEYHLLDNCTLAADYTYTKYIPETYREEQIDKTGQTISLSVTYKPL